MPTTSDHLATLRRLERETPEAAPRAFRRITHGSFTILYQRARATADRLLTDAEALREQLLVRYSGNTAPKTWSPKCQIYLYDRMRELNVGRHGYHIAGSGSSRASRLSPGLTLSRTISLAADDPELSSTLAHELTHVIFAELLGRHPPSWANEGLARLAESPQNIQRSRRLVRRAVASGDHFRLAELIAFYRPPDQATQLFYSQSADLVRFLLQRRDYPTFIGFIADLQSSEVDAALNKHYGVVDLAELERAWLAQFAVR
ncbi:MAG: hypothetical protein H6707_01235 [Deltaproteobacteria bacterium]|nr:hypothetical protein [Deltaproteobacteria bacterium]